MRGGRRDRRERDRGVVSVLSVFFVLLLLTFLAVIINIGRLMRTRGDVQAAADSAALAAAGNLEIKPPMGPAQGRSSQDFDPLLTGSAPDVALAHAEAFTVMDWTGSKPTLDPVADIQFGFWHLKGAETCAFSSGACTAGWEPAPTGFEANGIQLLAVNSVVATTHFPLPTLFTSIVKLGTTNFTARATAIGRRARANCALPIALSVCQLVDAGGFSCGVPKDLEFVSADNSHQWALGRIDLRNTATEHVFLRDHVRVGTYNHCSTDPAGAQYLNGLARMADGPDRRPNLIPVVHGLVGIRDDPGTQQAGRCTLGTTHVVAVVQPDGVQSISDCPGMAPPGPIPTVDASPTVNWPPLGQQRVIGYVNITFTSIRCHHVGTQILTQANCETQMDATDLTKKLANTCQGPASDPAAHLRIRVFGTVSCDAPVGPMSAPALGAQPRLIR
jgi:hypothetical protein